MTHREDCLTEDEARRRGREEYRSGWYSPYAMGDCYEAQEAYDAGMIAERRAEQARREAREQAEYEEYCYYQQLEEQRQMNAQYEQTMEQEFLDKQAPKEENPDEIPF